MMELKDRIAEAINSTGLSDSDFAKRMGKSKGVVTQWRDGTIKSLKAITAQNMQDLTGYRAEWLIRGKLPKKVDTPTEQDHLLASSSSVSENDTEGLHIKHYATGGAMGHGLILRDQPGVIREIVVSDEWLQKNTRNITSAKNLVVVTGFGDSMRPIFQPGDPLLVDTGVTTVDFDGIYFFRVENEGFVKRLQRIPGEGLVAISENKAYRDWTIKQDMDFQVFGRVIKAWSGQDY